jgi:hypothetical protein
MVTSYLRNEIDPYQLDALEEFARRSIDLVNRSGGTHHGYFLPLEGASDVAVALFSFPRLADYERYRAQFDEDPEFVEANRIRDETRCVRRYEKRFMRPLFAGVDASPHRC